MSAPSCQWNGEVRDGAVVLCPRRAVVVLRERGVISLAGWKPVVCETHMQKAVSSEVREAGRDWQIDHYLQDVPRGDK